MTTKTKEAGKTFDWPESKQSYLSEAEKDVLIQTGATFTIVGADTTEHETFGARAEFILDDDRIIAFGFGDPGKPGYHAVESRDQLVMEMAEHFKLGGAPITARLVQRGRVKLVVPATE